MRESSVVTIAGREKGVVFGKNFADVEKNEELFAPFEVACCDVDVGGELESSVLRIQ